MAIERPETREEPGFEGLPLRFNVADSRAQTRFEMESVEQALTTFRQNVAFYKTRLVTQEAGGLVPEVKEIPHHPAQLRERIEQEERVIAALTSQWFVLRAREVEDLKDLKVEEATVKIAAADEPKLLSPDLAEARKRLISPMPGSGNVVDDDPNPYLTDDDASPDRYLEDDDA